MTEKTSIRDHFEEKPYLNKLFFLLPFFVLLPFCFSWFGDDDFIYMRIFSGPWSDVFHKMFIRQIFGEGIDPHFRPLSNLFFALFLRSGSVFACHLLSIIVHLVTGIGVYFILKKALPFSAQSRTGYLLFMFNPIVLTAIFWFTALQDLLTTMFSVWAAYFFLKQGPTAKRAVRDYLVVMLLFVLALCAKEMSLTLPAILTVASVLRRSLKKDRLLLAILFAISIGFFLIRAVLLGHLFMGSMDNTYFIFDSHIVGVFTKYIYSLIFPTPIHLNYRFPVLYISAIPVVLLIGWYMLSKSWREVLRTGIVVCVLFFLAFAPTIGIFSIWRLYYPSVLWTIFIVFLLSNARFFGQNLWAYCYVGFLAIIMIIGGTQFLQAGKFEKSLLKQVSTIPDTSMVLLNVPAAYASQVPLVAARDEFEYALNRFFKAKKSVRLVATTMADRLPQSFTIRKMHDSTNCVTLDPHRYNYYYAMPQDSSDRAAYIEYAGPLVYGKPTSIKVTLRKPTLNVFVVQGND